eukprot:4089290-Ditylum_brightwellii.AAC.1
MSACSSSTRLRLCPRLLQCIDSVLPVVRSIHCVSLYVKTSRMIGAALHFRRVARNFIIAKAQMATESASLQWYKYIHVL